MGRGEEGKAMSIWRWMEWSDQVEDIQRAVLL